jgi:hypothetical protein
MPTERQPDALAGKKTFVKLYAKGRARLWLRIPESRLDLLTRALSVACSSSVHVSRSELVSFLCAEGVTEEDARRYADSVTVDNDTWLCSSPDWP